jgi:4-hydroxy-tetrahydrodipicolinate reductase
MREVRVVLYGLGAIGSLIAKSLLERDGVKIVGAVDKAEDKAGKDLGKVLGIEKNLGITISESMDTLSSYPKADLAIHATSSFLKETYPQIASILKHGVKVISTCEELSYPRYAEPSLATELDKLAKKHNATVLGTGINPGFLMDTLVITLTAVCEKIDKITAVRVMDAGKRRFPFQKKIGAGLKVEAFQEGIRNKQISGHVGLAQSIAMIADALVWRLDKITVEAARPVIAEEAVQSKEIKVKEGEVAGLRQKAIGVMHGKDVIALDFQAYIGAEEEYDSITIEGVPKINQKIQPCVHGDVGTVAMVLNAIPKVIKAPAGLLTMKDLPVPSAVLEDVRKYVEP